MNKSEIKERLDKASEGEWDNSTNERSEHPSVIYTDIDGEGSLIVAECRTVEDGDFIAHARQDVLDLVAEVDRKDTALEHVQELLERDDFNEKNLDVAALHIIKEALGDKTDG